jgi:hypothetical protein
MKVNEMPQDGTRTIHTSMVYYMVCDNTRVCYGRVKLIGAGLPDPDRSYKNFAELIAEADERVNHNGGEGVIHENS